MLISIPAGHGLIYGIIIYGIGVLIVAAILRMLLSWIRLDEGNNGFVRFLAKITDPFAAPIRPIVPRIGFFDVTFILSLILLVVLQHLLAQALPPGW